MTLLDALDIIRYVLHTMSLLSLCFSWWMVRSNYRVEADIARFRIEHGID